MGDLLTQAEGHVIERALGLNRRSRKPTRNRYVAGKHPANGPVLKEMAEKGLVTLEIDHGRNVLRHKRLSKHLKGELVARVTKDGIAAYLETINSHGGLAL